jgi:hypothetical protein
MLDQPGVVSRLIQAVLSLGITIVKQESTVINHLEQHFVEMVLELASVEAVCRV